ncbi:unnamed protein product [Calypogeia fissa]
MQGSKRAMRILLLSAVLVVLISFPRNALGQECELNCQTKNCSPEGVCICDIPSPDSLMQGNRNFLGGVFCSIPSVMCDGSNTFYCQFGGICNEIVQGENYTCTCPPGFAGEHCNFAGAICGDTYCYNGGACQVDLTGIGSCTCPDDFLGSNDCSVPTPIALPPAPEGEEYKNSKHHMGEWWVPVGIVIAIILSVAFVSGLAMSWYKRRMSKLSQIRFQELRQVQINEGDDFYNDGEDDPFRAPRNGNRKEAS